MDSNPLTKKLILKTASSESEIYFGRGTLLKAGLLCGTRFRGRRVHIVSDTNVAPLYLSQVSMLFEENGFTVTSTVLPAGETSKTLDSVHALYEDFVSTTLTRADLVVALGGGVIGDTTGFAAATYLRGINLCQIPTTLLAQVDSSVGGKCGVDLKSGKNLVGAFYQPHMVLIDPDMLNSLPEHIFNDGMAEVIKYGFIADKSILEKLESNLDNDMISDVILRSVEIKRDIVMQDERDTSIRMILNFGHTIGHALEKLGGFHALSHGQAVALGMKAALQLGILLGITEKSTIPQLNNLLDRFELNQEITYSAPSIADALLNDKKILSSTISFILIKTPGEAFIHNLSLLSLRQLIVEVLK
ncbi:MAG: 3-dehydroquinate synthase [Clostridiales bacterium]|nr:3-dehydroquinate synthase [Clostridiales bacterium]